MRAARVRAARVRGSGPARGGRAEALAGPLTGASLAAVAVKFGERQRSPHYLLVKEHQVREGAGTTHPARRTLFVLNVPPYCSQVSGLEAAGAGSLPGSRPLRPAEPPGACRGAARCAPRSVPAQAGGGFAPAPMRRSPPVFSAPRARWSGCSAAAGRSRLCTSATSQSWERRRKRPRLNSSPTKLYR